MISGHRATKTSLIIVPAAPLTAETRAVPIEDTAEPPFESPKHVLFEAGWDQAGLLPITIRDLLRTRLRHRPDRMVVGEVAS